MKSKTSTIKYIICIFLFILMGIQIIYGFRWMFLNIEAIPSFGDTQEYVSLSTTLELDEYRPIGYPLFLRYIIPLCSHFSISCQSVIYLTQSVVCYMALFYASKYSIGQLFCVKSKWIHNAILTYISLYLLCIPMITFMNFSVLTDSFATSFLLFALGAVCKLFDDSKRKWPCYFILTISLLLEYLLRADRMYSCTVFLLIIFSCYWIKKRGNYNPGKAAVLFLVVLLVTVGGCSVINHFTQDPGRYGRIKTNFDFVLLDRIVWPHMVDNYPNFPKEIQAVITLEEAETFDKHNNNVMYQLAPLLESRVGHKQACAYYRTMAKIVFRNHPIQIITDIAEDILCVTCTPVSALLSRYKVVSTANDWNLKCCSSMDKKLSKAYYTYYLYSFNFLLLICLCRIVFYALYSFIRKPETASVPIKGFKTSLQKHAPHLLMCIIIALWFSLGDGAPPNDRYALLHYIIWTSCVLGFIVPELFSDK